MPQADTDSTTSRRALLLAAGAVATIPATSGARAAVARPDAELLALGLQFEALELQYNIARAITDPLYVEYEKRFRVWSLKNPKLERSEDDADAAFRRIYEEIGLTAIEARNEHPEDYAIQIDPITRKIFQIPATSIAGLAVKARAAKFQSSSMWKESDGDADWHDLCARRAIDAVIETAARLAMG